MVDAIIHFSVRNKLAIFVAVALACAYGYWSMTHMRLDAFPDLGETQVIIRSTWDRSPDLIESQVTYPIITAMLGSPHVKAVRGFSDYGSSYVYVVFDDDTDLYWARSRVLEYLSAVRSSLPEDVKTGIGPDATSLGWVFQYAVVDTTGQHSLADLRTYQDWYLAYYLKAVPGVADVAPVGGFTRQYQVNLQPEMLQRYGISVSQVTDAVRGGNQETSGRMLDFGGTEYMVRGRGYAQSLNDFRQVVVATSLTGGPIRIKDLGEVVLGPEIRRGVADLDGNGDVVSGIVIMRDGENALQVIDRVKHTLQEIEPGLPPGIRIVPIYDRSTLIRRVVGSTEWTIGEIVVTVVVVILVFLWHFPSAVIPLVTMPAAVLIAFIPLRLLRIDINLMSLAGIAIAFGELIDASIVVVEQTHKRLEQWSRSRSPVPQSEVVLAAVKEVAGPTFFALLVIAVSLLPVLTLEAQEGRMFRPLAYSKTMAMCVAALLVVTLDPALRVLLSSGRRFTFRSALVSRVANAVLVGPIQAEEKHPLNRRMIKIYEPVVRWTLRHKSIVILGAVALILATIPVYRHLGSEYMPPMDEGAVLYMPSTLPGISIAQAQQILQTTDALLKQFPEVEHVLGKAGRADNATDPAPLSMLETLITLKPRSAWPRKATWYAAWAPAWSTGVLRLVTADTDTTEELIHKMDDALKVPGVRNAWTMPIKGRVDMLTSGIRSPLGVKITGDNSAALERLGEGVEAALAAVPGTRATFAERAATGYYIDVTWDREELARYGISMAQAQQTISSAIGGEDVSTVVEGRTRVAVNVRYMRDYRGSLDALGRILLQGSGGNQVPIAQVARILVSKGPAMIRDENGLLTSYVYVDLGSIDPGTYIHDADPALRRSISLPPGFSLTWSGQYQAMQRVRRRLQTVIPATLALLMLLIYLSTRSAIKTMIVMLAVPFSAIGAVWLLYLLHYNLSIAVWVGLIGLLSIDAETGVFMLLYLDIAYKDAFREGRLNSLAELREAVVYGAAKRLRPKFMTFATTCIGLLPVMWSTGAGADVLKRIAAPMVGGILTSFLLELLVYPAIYELWRGGSLARGDGSRTVRPAETAMALSVNGD